MNTRVPIAPEVLKWAVQKTGRTVEELSQQPRFHRLPSWIAGTDQPTLRQAEKLAQTANVPFPFLLLEHPFETHIKLPDFRTIGGKGVSHASPELEQVINDCQSRLDWYKEYAEGTGITRVNLLSQRTINDNPEESAQRIRELLGWEPSKYSYGDRAVSELAAMIEQQGILVMRSSMVQHNTHRPLDLQEFRGFTLIQDGYALIFINTKDTKSGQVFSLAHELGHVLLGEPGVSGEQIDGAPEVERWCNSFAAELLVPRAYLCRKWGGSVSDGFDQKGVKALANRLGVSAEAAAGGGHGINGMLPRLGTRFIRATANAVGSELLQVTDALYLLGLRNYNTALRLIESAGKTA